MHAEVKVLMRGTGFPDAMGVGCEEEEVRRTSGLGAKKPLIERKTVEGCSRRGALPCWGFDAQEAKKTWEIMAGQSPHPWEGKGRRGKEQGKQVFHKSQEKGNCLTSVKSLCEVPELHCFPSPEPLPAKFCGRCF